MRPALRSVLLGLATASLLLLPATTAAAEDDDHPSWRIDDYDVVATVDADRGLTHVQLNLDFNFGNDPGHGPYLTLPLRQGIGGDPDHWRALDVAVGEVSSPSGANAEVVTREEGGNLLVRVGSEGHTYTGVQSYTVNYTIHGLVEPSQAQSGLDEFNWNVVGDSWEVPIGSVTATVTGPVAVERVACFAGGGSAPCDDATMAGATASFSHAGLSAGEPMQIVAGFPAGTFTNAEPRLTTRYHIGNMFPVTPVTGGLAAVLTALGLGFLFQRTRRGARDEVYLGLTPGLTPAAGEQAVVGKGAHRTPVA
ncbi:MAG: DUF2207 domain-containing protein, partial [Propionicimonas sp.]|nr:DUF2207 domain-containing protein [Propionicimonas sp.]